MKSIKALLFSSVCTLAITACDADHTGPMDQAPASAQEDASAQTRGGKALAIEAFAQNEDSCAYYVGACLNSTRMCLDEADDGVCAPSFNDCRDTHFSAQCDSDEAGKIGLNSALRCWNDFDRCALDEQGDCAAQLQTCMAKGSICELSEESECDAQVCDAENCAEVRWDANGQQWGLSPLRGGRWPGGWWPRPGSSWPRPGSSWPRPGSSWWPRPGAGWPRPGSGVPDIKGPKVDIDP